MLKFKETILNTNYGSGCNSLFDVFINNLDFKAYLVSSNYKNCTIDIILLENNSLINSLKGHKNEILSIRYFLNEIAKDEYIISSDIEKNVLCGISMIILILNLIVKLIILILVIFIVASFQILINLIMLLLRVIQIQQE